MISLLRNRFLLRLRKSSIAESIQTSSKNFLHMSHTSSASGVSSLSLGTPVETSVPSTWVTTRGAGFLLDVVRTTTTSNTQGVRFVVFLTERLSSFRHLVVGA